MPLVSDERVREIQGMISEWEEGENMAKDYLVVAGIKDLLADREERKRDKEAVIAKIEEIIETVTPQGKETPEQLAHADGIKIACLAIKDFIRNPKEDTIGDTDR